MSRSWKLAAAVKEIDSEGKIKLGYFGIVARGDIKKENIFLVITTDLKNILKEMSSFLLVIIILMQLA